MCTYNSDKSTMTASFFISTIVFCLFSIHHVSCQTNCLTLGGSHNCSIPESYIDDDWCDCPTCIDETSWTCSTCSTDGCSTDTCASVQCTGVSTSTGSTNIPQNTQSTNMNTLENTTEEPPEDICIFSTLFGNRWGNKMRFTLGYGTTQINGGPVEYNYFWDDWNANCWYIEIVNNRWVIISYCPWQGNTTASTVAYCEENGEDYIPTEARPGNPADCVEWSVDDFKVSDVRRDCSFFDASLIWVDYGIVGYAGIWVIVLCLFMCKCGPWHYYCVNDTYDGLLLETYSQILKLHGVF